MASQPAESDNCTPESGSRITFIAWSSKPEFIFFIPCIQTTKEYSNAHESVSGKLVALALSSDSQLA
jgi:hypothetical protein